jgi:hypothetical protein
MAFDQLEQLVGEEMAAVGAGDFALVSFVDDNNSKWPCWVWAWSLST